MPKHLDLDAWVTIEDAADYLGVSSLTVRRRIQSGDLTAYRVTGGAAIRLRAADVRALMLPVTPTGGHR